METDTAGRYVDDFLMGGREMWLNAADAFLAHIRD
jgi:hypothetical protein